jgi:hypothetical protein
MTTKYEYRVVPTPRRPIRVKGAKTTQDRLAATLADLMNEQAHEGWEYIRAETLPCEESKGMFSKPVEIYTTLLVFRRAIPARTEAPYQRPALRPTLVATPEPGPRTDARPEGRVEPRLVQDEDQRPQPLSLGPARDDQDR